MSGWFQTDSSISGQGRLRDASGWERKGNKIGPPFSETWRTEPEDSEKVNSKAEAIRGSSLFETIVALSPLTALSFGICPLSGRGFIIKCSKQMCDRGSSVGSLAGYLNDVD
ncbi:hypothetical protein B0H13DRAFT_1873611 [Mycena leptocephala]|nr:hypothetical protein B0H13DRAFT_1873611 [Mycena leptocephala]